jgi:hypothetical protein
MVKRWLILVLILSTLLIVPGVLAWCTDYDGGQNYTIKSYTNGSLGIKQDVCSPYVWSPGNLTEQICSGGNQTNITISCVAQFGTYWMCSDGKCIYNYTAPPANGTLNVDSLPYLASGASISDNYIYQGVTPKVYSAAPGGHFITLTKPGFKANSTTVTVTSGQTTYVSLWLQYNNTCTDSDSGQYPNVFGYLSGYQFGYYSIYNDTCIGTSIVNETYCSGTTFAAVHMNCSSGYTCSNGACICTNDCGYSGQTECSGTGYRTCGYYDLDSCLDWSNVTNCSVGQTCVNGSCVAVGQFYRVFVTNSTWNGNLGGLAGADAKCQAAANAAGLGSTRTIWKAWLSTNVTNASSRLYHSNIPYKRIDGAVVANNWADLTDGSLQNPINVTEYGSTIGRFQEKLVWTGTNYTGLSLYSPYSCNNWLSTASNGHAGTSNKTDVQWTLFSTPAGIYPFYCGNLFRLYCFEQPKYKPAPAPVPIDPTVDHLDSASAKPDLGSVRPSPPEENQKGFFSSITNWFRWLGHVIKGN